MRMRLKVEGTQAAMLRMDKYGEAFCNHLGPTVLKAANVIRDDAKKRAKGSISSSIESEITWDRKKSKAFAAVCIPKKFNDQFVYFVKGTRGGKAGNRYYIPTAVEYGHRPPNSDKETVYQVAVYKRGKKKGQAKPVRYANQVSKKIPAHPFIRPAYKSQANRNKVKSIIQDYISGLTLNWGD